MLALQNLILMKTQFRPFILNFASYSSLVSQLASPIEASYHLQLEGHVANLTAGADAAQIKQLLDPLG